MTAHLHLENVFDVLEDGILIFDGALAPVWMNRACGRLLGLDPAELAPGGGAVPGPVVELIRKLGLSAAGGAAGEQSKRVQRLELQRPARAGEAGGVLPVEAVLTWATLETGRFLAVSLRDISAQQQMERAVYEARKTQAVGVLAGGIAHDFNNILTAVISQIDLVLYGGELPESLRQHLIYAQTSARRGAELVGKLQAFSRQSPPKFDVVDLGEVVDQAVFMLKRGVTPSIQIRPPETGLGRLPVRADSSQILQVILNIGINARDAMPKGGTLSLTLEAVSFGADAALPRRAGEFVCLRMRDTGHGMPAEVRARIFEPYFSTKDLSRGPGLGLSIASSVVAEHSGWIEVESSEGMGACFSIYLPRGEASLPARPVAVPESRPAGGGERILVVDDEELVRMVTKAVLSYRGYQVFEAEDGEDAVEKHASAQPPYALVLMDLHMPRLNGYDALVRIRRQNPAVKAILLSGGSQDPASLGGDLEGVAYLQKPFDNQELAATVRRLLDAR